MDYFHTDVFGMQIVNTIMTWGIINFGLFVFNLIPIPPLDGSHIYLTYLKEINPKLMMNMYRWGMFVLFAIIISENQFNINILHLSEFVGGITKFFVGILEF